MIRIFGNGNEAYVNIVYNNSYKKQKEGISNSGVEAQINICTKFFVSDIFVMIPNLSFD